MPILATSEWRRRYMGAIRAMNENHDELGRFAESAGSGAGGSDDSDVADFDFEVADDHGDSRTDTVNWTPAKTPEAASAWAKDSTVTTTLYHGTSVDVADKIKSDGFKTGRSAFGTGVYLAIDKNFADSYQRGKQEGKGATVETKINVSKLLKIKDSFTGYEKAAKSMGVSKKEFDKITKEKLASGVGGDSKNRLAAMGEAISSLAGERGYHGLDVDSSTHFYVVFDPKRVTMIDKTVKAVKASWASRYLAAMNPNHDELGRFAESPGEGGGAAGGGGASPPKPAEVSHHERYQAAKKNFESNKRAYERSKAALVESRKMAFGAARDGFRAAIADADSHADKVNEAVNNVASVGSNTTKDNSSFAKAFYAFEANHIEYDTEMRPSEKRANLSKAAKLASKALAKLSAVVPVENSDDHLSAKDIAENNTHLVQAISSAMAGKSAIERAVGHLRQAKAIKTGEDAGDVKARGPNALAAYRVIPGRGRQLDRLEAINENHDPDDGRFTTGGGGAGGGDSVKRPGLLKRAADFVKQKLGLGGDDALQRVD